MSVLNTKDTPNIQAVKWKGGIFQNSSSISQSTQKIILWKLYTLLLSGQTIARSGIALWKRKTYYPPVDMPECGFGCFQTE